MFHIEFFSEKEREILLRHFTNVDKPVFCLINLPEVVKSALFARYSRSNKSLRRLFLDEFHSHEMDDDANKTPSLTISSRADKLFERVFVEYGDDSVAQLGGAHIACEQVSNILVKVLEWGRLAGYLEQSTRYVYYNQKRDGKYNFVTPDEIRSADFGDEYDSCVNQLFDTYSTLVEKLVPGLRLEFPILGTQTSRGWESTLRAKACDIVRGLLPAATKTNMGIYANGQAYEALLIRMFASSNQEVIEYASMILDELRKVIPSFLRRVDLEDRGKISSKYIADINLGMVKHQRGPELNKFEEETSIDVRLIDWDDHAEKKILAAALYEYSQASLEDIENFVDGLSIEKKKEILETYAGERTNRRHKPGRAFERIFYKFDILSDYGSFRDLQRHRMLTIQWQKLSPYNGYTVPAELDRYPELRQLFIEAVQNAGKLYETLAHRCGAEIAQYVVPFAYQIRYSLQFNLREAFHLIELRTQKQGHINYRKICLEMYDQILKSTNHEPLLKLMTFVDSSEYSLSRLESEKMIDNILNNA
jgi:thymidylate synthase ThyX